MRSVPLLMTVWSNAVVCAAEPVTQVHRLLPLTGIDVPAIRDGEAAKLADLWRSWSELEVTQIRLLQPRPGRPISLQPTEVARAGMRVGSVLAAIGSGQALLPRFVRGQLVAWDVAAVNDLDALAQTAIREAERDFAVVLREETEWLDAQVQPAGDAELAALREELATPAPPVPTTLPDANRKLLSRCDQVLVILRGARAAPEPVSAAARTARLAALARLEAATLTLQEAAASGWVA